MVPLVLANGRPKVVAGGAALGFGLGFKHQAGGKSSGFKTGPSQRMTARSSAVVQLADVSPPGGGHEAADGGVVDTRNVLAQPAGMPAQEHRHQFGDVLAAVTQRREMNRDHVEPVIQILAEPFGGDLSQEILVGRGYQPGLKRDGPGRADGQHILVLDRPQQLGLG